MMPHGPYVHTFELCSVTSPKEAVSRRLSLFFLTASQVASNRQDRFRGAGQLRLPVLAKFS